MRSIIHLGLLLVVSGLSSNTHAQGNFPFPDSAALWVQTYSFMVVQPPFPQFEVQAVANIQMNGLDTMIQGASYSKMTDAVSGAYYGAVRDEGGRVWYVPVDSANAYLLFDFSVNPGDTVRDLIYYQAFPMVWGGPYLVDAVVTDVQTDPAWGGRLVVQTDFWGTWIEGIGHQQGLLAEPDINVSGYQLRLECMSHLDTVRFRFIGDPPFEEPGTCIPLSVGIGSLAPSARQWMPYPNPSTGSFKIRSQQGSGIASVQAFDQTGRSVPISLQSTLNEDECVVQLGIAMGIYMLRVRFADGSVQVGSVCIER